MFFGSFDGDTGQIALSCDRENLETFSKKGTLTFQTVSKFIFLLRMESF